MDSRRRMVDDARLYLLRHGAASGKSDSNTYEDDYVRPLNAKGVRQSIDAGKVLRKIAPRIDHATCSPRIRCVQTAVLTCQELKGTVQPHRDKQLLQMSNHAGERLITDGQANLAVVHGPEMDDLIKKLTGRDVHVSRGTIAGIHIVNGQGTLEQLLTPKDTAAIARGTPAPNTRLNV